MSPYNDLRLSLRSLLRDVQTHRYTDSFLDSVFDLAQREYSVDTLKLTRDFECVAIGGRVILPEDFICPNRFTDTSGDEIPFVKWTQLERGHGVDWYRQPGQFIHSICFDGCDIGTFRTYPVIPDGVIGTLNYSRLPQPGKPEIKDTEAVLAWARFYISLIENSAEAEIQYQKYTERVIHARAEYAAARVHRRSGGIYF